MSNRYPVKVTGDKWFYLGRRGKCSFHDGKTNQHVHGFPLKAILKAITQDGMLAAWDSKRLRFKP